MGDGAPKEKLGDGSGPGIGEDTVRAGIENRWLSGSLALVV